MSITPTPEQQAILDLGLTSIRVRAGAGTGKTTTIALVISNLVRDHGLAPERVLGLTFTNKAAAELSARVGDLLDDTVDQARRVEVHTYHGFAAQLLSEFGALAGVEAPEGVITPTFARQVIRDVFYQRSYQSVDMTNRQSLDQIRRLGDELGDHLLRPEDLLRASDIHRGDEVWESRVEMAETLSGYNRAKAELGVVDYADLVTLSTRVLQEHPALTETVRRRYHVIVLDEYQDTNPAQRVLLTTLFAGGFPVVAVGDEDQTIYEWRGASAENFEGFLDHFPTSSGEPAHDRRLTLNRRSGQDILDLANLTRSRANPGADRLEPAKDEPTEVRTFWAEDALVEAEWIAAQFEALHDQGTAWSDMAVLFRKNKDFSVILDVLGRHDIPMEVANVGGLLAVPEIAFLRAWLSILQYPEDSASLAQVLMGSGYRLGLGDLAALSRHLGSIIPGGEDDEDPATLTLIEAIEDLAAIEGLRPDARDRLAHFYGVYRELLVETQGHSLVESCRLILERTRAWQDVESLQPSARLTARLNLYRFLDLAEDWSPLSGRPSVAAFLDYLETMEEEPAEELDSARLSGEDAVTLVTVHRAKGLEWENVAIPALAKGNFPARAGAFPDPVRFPYRLPVELRLDTTIADLPDDDTARRAYLRDRLDAQEWRVAYVAVTRAKRRLFLSGAYWYGLPEPRLTPAEPSELFEIAESLESSIDDGHALPGPRPETLRSSDTGRTPDPIFAGGWAEALRIAREDPGEFDRLVAELGVNEPHEELVADWQDRLFALDELTEAEAREPSPTVSVTGLVTYAQCPKMFYWATVDPLPRRRNPAALRGTEIHRQIELDQRGEMPFDELSTSLYDTVASESVGPGAFDAYKTSRFARRADLIEAPFVFETPNGYAVRGRIDAVYVEDGRWEVVDFKSGRRSDEPAREVQLQAYAIAASDFDFGLPPPSEVEVTFAYLGGGLEEVRSEADEAWVEAARERIEGLTDDISAGVFPETPGPACHGCDFLRFCEPGLREVAR